MTTKPPANLPVIGEKETVRISNEKIRSLWDKELPSMFKEEVFSPLFELETYGIDVAEAQRVLDSLIVAEKERENCRLNEESEARAGVIKRLTDAGTIKCPECGGASARPSMVSPDGYTCRTCKGRGVILVVQSLKEENERLTFELEQSKFHEKFQSDCVDDLKHQLATVRSETAREIFSTIKAENPDTWQLYRAYWNNLRSRYLK